jgi:hypothetical protein
MCVLQFSTILYFDLPPPLIYSHSQHTAINRGEQTVVLYQGLTVVPLVGYGENTSSWVQIYLHGYAKSEKTVFSLPFTTNHKWPYILISHAYMI